MSIKINIQKKFYIWLKGEIKKKINLAKEKGNQKNEGLKLT
jgi:hypothetical protein